MPGNLNNASILSQLDESEKSEIITDEELEEIGAAYGSRKKYEQTMRDLAIRLSGSQPGRGDVYVPVGVGKTSPRIKAGTSTVPVGNLPKIKRVNVVGKTINSANDAALLFSLFRNPRIEIFNVAYTSSSGKVLAHTAWTCGLPNAVSITYDRSNDDLLYPILKTMEKLDAVKIWIAHNHPSGVIKPSIEDINATKMYSSYFREKFGGHIVLDHKEFTFINFDGNYINQELHVGLNEYENKYRINRRVKSSEINSPTAIANMFKRVLSTGEETSVYAILDGKNRVVSWLYGGHNDTHELKDYMRAAGGAKVIVLTNNGSLFKNYCNAAKSSVNTKDDVFLDVIHINRIGEIVDDFASNRIPFTGQKWQLYDNEIRFIVDNKITQRENRPLMGPDNNSKENTMSDLNEDAAVETAARKELSPRELAYLDSNIQRKAITNALKNGTCSCLPGADGYADTSPAYNLVNWHIYQGDKLLFLKDHQKQHGFPTAEYATSTQIDRAREDNPDLLIIKGQKGVTIHFSEKTEEGDYVEKQARLFNVAQLNSPQLFRKWAEAERLANFSENLEYQRSIHGDAYKPPEAKENVPAPEIVCSSTEPEKYLGQYLAAVSMGTKFKASPEQSKEFTQNMLDSLYDKTIIAKTGKSQGEYIPDPFKLSKISREANKYCKEVIRETLNGPKISQEQKQEQKQEHKQEHKRGRSL